MYHNKVASGSTGNLVLYHDNTIAVDMGVCFSLVQPFVHSLQIVLLTHQHHDHFNIKTIQTLSKLRPALRFGCGKWLVDTLQKAGVRNIDIYEIGVEYDYGYFSMIPVRLYHDVENIGYRIFKDGYKIFHATDSQHLDGITAREYNLYAIEHNYNEDTIQEAIKAKRERGEFVYEEGAIKSHLSEQQARQFIFDNKGENYEVLRLHESNIIR